MRKKAASTALPASMLRIHDGNSPRAEMLQPRAAKKIASAIRRTRRKTSESRKYFNLHLLRTDVVSDVLGGDGQLVGAGDGFLGNR